MENNGYINMPNPIYQGQISFGSYDQSTNLGSCLSLVLIDRIQKVGGLSHITGRNQKIGSYNFPQEVVDYYKSIVDQQNLKFPRYILIGGSDSCQHIIDMTIDCLIENKIVAKKFEVGGMYHRRVILSPSAGSVRVFPEPLRKFK